MLWPVGLSTLQTYCNFTILQTIAKRNFDDLRRVIGIYGANYLIISTKKKLYSDP